MFELLVSICGSTRFAPLLKPVLPELVYTSIGYIQVGGFQEQVWMEALQAALLNCWLP
jgi:hypothetical protein